MLAEKFEVVVVGAGNAALCAALAAAEHKISVLVLERAPESESGGNSRFTAGAIRCVYDGVDDLRALMPDLSAEMIAITDFGQYTEENFFDDMGRVTEYRADPDLVERLVKCSRPTLRWLREKGVRFAPIYGRQAFKVDGRFKFWGGLTIEAAGGGPGLVTALTEAAHRAGITIAYKTRAVSVICDDEGVTGVRVRHDGKTQAIRCKAVVLAAGGFESTSRPSRPMPSPAASPSPSAASR
jgi:tricarballylate dehydrogenase